MNRTERIIFGLMIIISVALNVAVIGVLLA
jgi:hypothetical protein